MALINKLNAVGDAIRAKTGKTDLLTLDDMVTEIAAIETGGGAAELPEEAFNFTGDLDYTFQKNRWAWFLEEYGEKLKFNNITKVNYTFANSDKLEHLPFEINVNNTSYFQSVFYYCANLKTLPVIKGTIPIQTANYSNACPITNVFTNCYVLKEIPYDFFNNFISEEAATAANKYTSSRSSLFNSCYSIRSYPDISRLKSSANTYASLYSSLFSSCCALDEIVDLPVLDGATFTSNLFQSTFAGCTRLKKLTFKTNEDGSPIAVNWSNQTIDLTFSVGFGSISFSSNLENYAGFTNDTEVLIDEHYAALKDNPDYYTPYDRYSRYSRSGAIETINSLPDVTSGSSNIIKFKGSAGSSTDDGAINTLTEEEIAVATAKGWTVTLA